MTDIHCTFSGLNLRSPIIAASAPPTQSVQSIVKLANAGIGAIVTKSTSDYQRVDQSSTPRRTLCHSNSKGSRHWSMFGSFGSETLTLPEALELHRAVCSEVDIPIISSVAYLGDEPQKTVDSCGRLAEAGSSMIHLDLFYTPQPRASDSALAALRELILTLKHACNLPITAKLNLDYPAHLIANHEVLQALDGIFLLDSLRTPIGRDEQGGSAIPNLTGATECSLFGSWQKPLTLQYTQVLARAISQDICSGGGLQNADDILQAIQMGATVTQFATPIMEKGADWVRRTNKQLQEKLARRGFKSLREFKASTGHYRVGGGSELVQVNPVSAWIDAETCAKCDKCVQQMFCESVHGESRSLPWISEECTGCGFCVGLCPTTPKSIQLKPISTTAFRL